MDDGIEVQRPGEEDKEEEEVGGEWNDGAGTFADGDDGRLLGRLRQWVEYGDGGECAHCGEYDYGGEPDHGGDGEEEDDAGQWYYEEGENEPYEEEEEEEEGEW